MQHKPGPHMLFHISRANKWLNYKEVRWSKNNKIKKLKHRCFSHKRKAFSKKPSNTSTIQNMFLNEFWLLKEPFFCLDLGIEESRVFTMDFIEGNLIPKVDVKTFF